MQLVVDANILFSAAKQDSTTRFLLDGLSFTLYAPEFCLQELKKYKSLIMQKAGITDFSLFLDYLQKNITFVSFDEYAQHISSCKKALSDVKDVEYIALAKHLHLVLWSNDVDLKRQTIVSVISTRELISLLDMSS